MEEASKYIINFVREVYLYGEQHYINLVTKLLKPYHYLAPRDLKDLAAGPRTEVCYVIGVADFSTPEKMQGLAKVYAEIESPFAHKVIFIIAPEVLTTEQLLFAQELGARYVCAGPQRGDALKEYMKRHCLEAHQVGSLSGFETDLEAACRDRDRAALERVTERLKALPADTEDGLRLLAQASMHMGEHRRAEAYLRRLLQLNAQNLWAANTLGKLYLRSGKGAQGLELLQKLSLFHELNSDRLLVLGDALVLAGKPIEAEGQFQKGDRLTGGNDERFKEGLAKVKLAEKDLTGALACLSGRKFSDQIISFLNTRAILAIRGERYDEGLEYYTYALKGVPESDGVRAKLLFNMGLAYVRSGNLGQAEVVFRESALLGGDRFKRARGPLETVTNAIKARSKPGSVPPPSDSVNVASDLDWETLY